MKHVIIVVLLLVCVAKKTAAQSEVFVKSGEAIGGYDPVAYFRQHKPVKGKDEFKAQWKGATWKFASAQNRDDFKASPEQYAPQFGGYCAYGVSDNHKAPTQPDAWTIVDGKLYLNYNTDVKKLWSEKRDEHIERAVKNWPVVKLEKD